MPLFVQAAIPEVRGTVIVQPPDPQELSVSLKATLPVGVDPPLAPTVAVIENEYLLPEPEPEPVTPSVVVVPIGTTTPTEPCDGWKPLVPE
jgi:hypothetical protein